MELWKLTALELGKALKNGEYKISEAVEALHRREGETAACNAYISVDWDWAMAEANRLQKRLDAGEKTSPLFGVPVMLKDNICTKGIPTTCASKMLKNFIPPYDASVTEKLKEAGMLILGKGNMDEFAMGSTGETSCFGSVKNPWDLERVPGGSSSGPAAAVAAGAAFCALGSDTGGSIRQPASHCGITGIKPTYGRVSRYGLVAYASSMDQIGNMARTAEDCAALLALICGRDTRDMTTMEGKPVIPKETGVKKMRIGVPVSYLETAAEEVRNCIRNGAEILKELGAEVEETELAHTEEAVAAYYILASAEAASNLSRYDGWKYGYSVSEPTLEERLSESRTEAFGEEVKRRILLGNFVLSAGYMEDYYRRAQRAGIRVKQAFAEFFSRFDLLLAPTAPSSAPMLGTALKDPVQMYGGDCHTVGVNLAGLPAMTLPGGRDKQGMPVGIQLIAPAMEEERLFRAGIAFQRATAYHQIWPEVKRK